MLAKFETKISSSKQLKVSDTTAHLYPPRDLRGCLATREAGAGQRLARRCTRVLRTWPVNMWKDRFSVCKAYASYSCQLIWFMFLTFRPYIYICHYLYIDLLLYVSRTFCLEWIYPSMHSPSCPVAGTLAPVYYWWSNRVLWHPEATDAKWLLAAYGDKNEASNIARSWTADTVVLLKQMDCSMRCSGHVSEANFCRWLAFGQVHPSGTSHCAHHVSVGSKRHSLGNQTYRWLTWRVSCFILTTWAHWTWKWVRKVARSRRKGYYLRKNCNIFCEWSQLTTWEQIKCCFGRQVGANVEGIA